MNVRIDGNQLVITRDDTDPKYYNSQWGSAESRLLYHVKKVLIKMGFDVIKKNPQKDNHLVSNDHYLREKKGRYCIIDQDYAVRNLAEDFNKDGIVKLTIHGEMKVGDK